MTPSLHFHDAEFRSLVTTTDARILVTVSFFLSFFDDLDSFLENYVRLYMYCMMKEFPVLTASGLRVCSSRYFERHSEISATIQKEVELWVKIWTLAVTIRHSNTREGGCNTRPFI